MTAGFAAPARWVTSRPTACSTTRPTRVPAGWAPASAAFTPWGRNTGNRLRPGERGRTIGNGPAYLENPKSETRNPKGSDWPVYRHDIVRSGQATTALGVDLKPAWSTPLGGKLTPPVVAAGRVYVSRQDANEIVCLDAGSGEVRWRYSTPSYVDSPPTVVDGRLLFGCADGQVYCLNAADGALIWRFRVAPAEMLIVDDSRVASKWPVHGSVLVKDGIAFCTAGRSSFLDGGIQVVKLDVATGKLLGHARLDGPWHDPFQVNTIVPSEESGQAGRTHSVHEGYYPAWIDIEVPAATCSSSTGPTSTWARCGSRRLGEFFERAAGGPRQADGRPAAAKSHWTARRHLLPAHRLALLRSVLRRRERRRRGQRRQDPGLRRPVHLRLAARRTGCRPLPQPPAGQRLHAERGSARRGQRAQRFWRAA